VRKSLLLFAFLPALVRAQSFEFNAACRQAYQSIFKLKIAEGLQQLEKEKKSNPKNYLPYFIENYADFLKLFVNDNTALFSQAEPRVEERLKKLKSGDPHSPYYLYTQADVHLQWAFCKIKFGEYVSAVFEVKKAYSMLQENNEKFPNFKPNIKSLGLLHTLFGAVPDKYKFGARLLGMKGSIEQGLKELNSVMNDEDFPFKDETVILYTLLVLHLQKDQTAAWNMVERTHLSLGDNLLNYFVAATVASHTGKNDNVISLLSSRPSGPAYYPFPLLDFIYGNAKLNRLDSDAHVYIHQFLQNNKGRSYVKEALRKLAWQALINGSADQYKKMMQQVRQVSDAPTDEDKSAQREAEQGFIPNKFLLKARLLCDGGYYDKALDVMHGLKQDKLAGSRDQVEYLYRQARIYDELQRNTEAVRYYLQTVQTGQAYPYYFAANACIKLGAIFEQQGKVQNAKRYYQKAIDLDKDEYSNSIDAEAKAGLNRLGD
jgi:tetratricopeptide (TPR) repeat protein